jgi:hypothetical protein
VEKANTIYAFSSADFAKQSAPRSEKNERSRGRSRGKRPSSP